MNETSSRGREGEGGAVSLVTVDMHKGLNGNRAETRRNQTASWEEVTEGARESNWKNGRGARFPDASSRIHFASKGPLFFHPLCPYIR